MREDAAGKLDLAFADRGEQRLKNIERPVHVYSIDEDNIASSGTGTIVSKCADAAYARVLTNRPAFNPVAPGRA